MEDGWKVRMNICTALWSFVNFCCLSQSEVNTDNRKVSTFFGFQHVCCRYCYRSYLDRFSKDYLEPYSITQKVSNLWRHYKQHLWRERMIIIYIYKPAYFNSRAQIVINPKVFFIKFTIITAAIIGFHMTSLKLKLQNYRSYWDFTFMVY